MLFPSTAISVNVVSRVSKLSEICSRSVWFAEIRLFKELSISSCFASVEAPLAKDIEPLEIFTLTLLDPTHASSVFILPSIVSSFVWMLFPSVAISVSVVSRVSKLSEICSKSVWFAVIKEFKLLSISSCFASVENPEILPLEIFTLTLLDPTHASIVFILPSIVSSFVCTLFPSTAISVNVVSNATKSVWFAEIKLFKLLSISSCFASVDAPVGKTEELITTAPVLHATTLLSKEVVSPTISVSVVSIVSKLSDTCSKSVWFAEIREFKLLSISPFLVRILLLI